MTTARARERAVAELRDVAAALEASGDAAAAEVVGQAIESLQVLQRDVVGGGRGIPRRLARAARGAPGRVGATVGAASKAALTAARSGAAGTKGSLAAAKAAVDKAGGLVLAAAAGTAGGFAAAHHALGEFAANLDWSSLPAEYAGKFAAAGTRGIERTLAEARLVWETIPEPLRASGPEEVARRLEGFDWSHIVPYSEGGSGAAWNGIFERAADNRARGAEQMTAAEINAAEQALLGQAFQAALAEVAGQMLAGAAAAAAVACVMACLEDGLAYQRGEFGRDEMCRRIARKVAQAAGVGAAVSGIMTVVALTFPAVIPVAAPLMLPLALLGLCAMGGKVVRLGKGWYEVLRDVRMGRLRAVEV